LGNASPSNTHTTGPHDMPNATTNRFAAIRAMGPVTSVSTGAPSAFSGAVPKTTASVPSVIAIPTEPISSSGRRPKRSTLAMAISVVAMFTTDVMTVMMNESLSLKPTASHRTFE
jgi:hypothetical protein